MGAVLLTKLNVGGYVLIAGSAPADRREAAAIVQDKYGIGITVVAITTFIGSYAQQFIFALTFNSKTEYMPLPVGLFAYFGRQEVVWNELMAASFVGIAPAMILIFLMQRYLVAGLTAGAVKQ